MRLFLRFLATLVLVTSSIAFAERLEIPVAVDYWQYVNALDPATRELGPVWVSTAAEVGEDRRHGMNVFKFDFTPVSGSGIVVTTATLVMYDIQQAQWPVTGAQTAEGHPSRLELFAAGFGPAYDELAWNGTQPRQFGPRDPFPRDLATDDDIISELLGTTPWAIGEPVGYTPGAMSAPFPIVYELDVEDPRIQSELLADLAQGISSWVLSGTFEITAISTPGEVPNVIMEEGVASRPGSAPPTLIIEYATQQITAAQTWHLYQ